MEFCIFYFPKYTHILSLLLIMLNDQTLTKFYFYEKEKHVTNVSCHNNAALVFFPMVCDSGAILECCRYSSISTSRDDYGFFRIIWWQLGQCLYRWCPGSFCHQAIRGYYIDAFQHQEIIENYIVSLIIPQSNSVHVRLSITDTRLPMVAVLWLHAK